MRFIVRENSVTNSTNGQEVPKRAWLILAVTYFASVMAPMMQFKVPALASWLFPAYHMDPVTFASLMSYLTVMGVVLAFPAAFICRRFGLKAVVLFSIACLAAGSVLGAMTHSITILKLSRVVEGLGIGLIGVAAPTCISVWFPVRIRGLALGLWATWVPFGIVFMFNGAPFLASHFGFRTVFWICSGLCVLAFILFAVVFKMPEGKQGHMVEGTFLQNIRILNNRNIWILGAVFFLFSFCTLGISNTFYNTFLEKVLGFSAQKSASITSLNMVVSFLAAPLAGLLSDYFTIEKKHYAVVIMMGMVLVSVFFMFVPGPNAVTFMWIFVIIQGFAGGEGGGACRPIAPLALGNTAAAATMGMAVLQFCQNLGQCVGSPTFGWMLEYCRGDWMKANMLIEFPLLGLGIILAFFIRSHPPKPRRKRVAEGEAVAQSA